jgi:heme exporter protein A
MLAIEVENLARRYGRRWALAGVSFSARQGSVVMIAGRNGSGKSTLLRVLATAIRPDAGSAKVAGFDVVRDREDVRQTTALLSHASYLYNALSARENLGLIVRDAATVDRMLDRVGLLARANDAVTTYSAGMRKRLSFARVLLQTASVVMLDEPYGQLDPEGFTLVDEVVSELKARGKTLLIATHQVEHVTILADQVLTLDGGRLC